MTVKKYLSLVFFLLILFFSKCTESKNKIVIPDQFEMYYMWTTGSGQSAIDVKSSSDTIVVSNDTLREKHAITKVYRDSLFMITMAEIQNIDLSLPDQLESGTALVMVIKSAGKSYSVQYDRIALKSTSNKNVKSVFRILSMFSGGKIR